jgi:hypothetical protein
MSVQRGSRREFIRRCVSRASLALAICLLAWPAQSPAQSASASGSGAPPITVQIEPPPVYISSAMLGVSSPLGAQSASGKPIVAEITTEHHQSFADGTHISHSTFSSIYRDAQGRIRRESQLSVPGLSEGIATATFITIVDHQLGFGFILNPQEMVAHRYELNAAGPSYVARLSAQAGGSALLSPDAKPSTTASPATSADGSSQNAPPNTAQAVTQNAAQQGAPWRPHAFAARNIRAATNSGPAAESAPSMRIDQPFLAAPNPVRTENLGEQVLLGFRVHGTRVITTLPAGQIGNDRPIDIISEQWFSPDLELVMRSVHHDPWAGDFTTTVTKVSRGDQPTALFEIPAAYKIIDAATEGEHHILDGHGTHSPGPAPW